MAETDYSALRRAMITNDLAARDITDPHVLRAMADVPRHLFVPTELASQAYDDCALPIDCEQTISQPYIVALMTQALTLTGDERVLEVGTGSGYQTAVLAQMVRSVVTIERHPQLARAAAARIAAAGYRNVEFVHGDGTQGWPRSAPYDAILVAAATISCPPLLLEQLADPGRLVIPLGLPATQVLFRLDKCDAQITKTRLSECRFVPLIADDEEG